MSRAGAVVSLKRWTLPRDYMGARWDGYLVFLSQHRDSDSVTRSNFTVARAALDKLPDFPMPNDDTESRIVVRESHWAVGWVEWIAIHETDAAAIEAANAMLARLENYPILSEDHCSELEWNEAADYWAALRVCDRLELCIRFGLSIFAARHDYLPSDDDGSLLEYLRA